jgi:glucose-1-phosphatase
MDAYLFDLGNVLVGFSHRIFCRRLAEECRPWREDDILRIVFGSDLNERFERGRIEGEDFYAQVRSLLGFSLSLDRFRDLWCDIFWENPGMAALLKSLRHQARLLLVSNTNPWHIEYSQRKFEVLGCFDRLVLSYEVGAVKPEKRFFEAALEAAGTRPERCMYFDDLEENVRAAARLGIPSAQFRFLPA